MGRPISEGPKTTFLKIRVTEDLNARIDLARSGPWASTQKQDFVAYLIELGLRKQAGMAAKAEEPEEDEDPLVGNVRKDA